MFQGVTVLKALKVSTLQLTSKIKPQSAPQASDNNFEPLDRTVFIHIDNGLKKKKHSIFSLARRAWFPWRVLVSSLTSAKKCVRSWSLPSTWQLLCTFPTPTWCAVLPSRVSVGSLCWQTMKLMPEIYMTISYYIISVDLIGKLSVFESLNIIIFYFM